jgi:integrase
MALTKRAIDGFKWDGRPRDIRWDGTDGVPFFGIRCNSGGSKTFMVEYRLPGSRKKTLYSIGKFGKWTLQQAREKAREILVSADQGIDPKAPAKAEGVTLGGFAPIFMDDMRTRGMRTAGEMERRIQKRLVPQLGKKDLVDITRADVTKLHGAIGKTAKIEANRCIQLLKAVLTRAEMMGHLPAGSMNPCKGIDLYKETSRTRYLDTRELMALRGALQDEPAWVRGLIRFYLVSGLRKMELLSLPWDAVKLNHPEGDHLDISMTKNGRDLRLALTAEMTAILQSIPSRMHSPWVFPSPVRPAHHLSDFKKVWQRVRSKAGLEDVNVHDLRRTTGSILAQAGVPLEHISQVLNHSNSEITRVYARLHKDNQRDALAVSSKVLDEVFGELELVPQRAEVSD